MPKRADDIKMLEEVLEEEMSSKEEDAFNEMLEWIKASPTRCLSEKQRSWLERVHERSHPTYLHLYSSGQVPKGNDVPLPPVLQNLPKFPPGRQPKKV